MSACDVKALADRVKGALFGLLIGDALSMPTHWFYGGERQVLHWSHHLADSTGTGSGYLRPYPRLCCADGPFARVNYVQV